VEFAPKTNTLFCLLLLFIFLRFKKIEPFPIVIKKARYTTMTNLGALFCALPGPIIFGSECTRIKERREIFSCYTKKNQINLEACQFELNILEFSKFVYMSNIYIEVFAKKYKI
jgi:hypothetical protein